MTISGLLIKRGSISISSSIMSSFNESGLTPIFLKLGLLKEKEDDEGVIKTKRLAKTKLR